MAAVTLGVAFHNTAAGPHASGAFTPAAGDLLVAAYFGTGTSGVVPTCTSTGNTDAWTLLDTVIFETAGNNGRLYIWVQNSLAAAVSTNVTMGVTDDNTSGGHVIVFRVSGMTKTGSTAKKQSSQDNVHATGTPQAAAMAAAVTTTNPTIGLVHDEGTATGWTPPTGWTELDENVITVPDSRSEVVSRDSGYTGTTITWGSASTGEYASYFLELDASGAGGGGGAARDIGWFDRGAGSGELHHLAWFDSGLLDEAWFDYELIEQGVEEECEPQVVRPSGTTSNDWSLNGAATAHACLNDESDSTYIHDNIAADASGPLGDLTDPGVDTGHIIKIRLGSVTGTGAAEFFVYQGDPAGSGTVISPVGTTFLPEPGTPTEYEYNIPEADAANITDYTDLYWRLVTGGGTFTPIIYEFRLEIPCAEVTTFLQNLVATVTVTAALLKRTNRTMAITTTLSVAIAKLAKKILAVGVTLTAALARAITKLLWAGAVTLTAAFSKAVSKILWAGTVTLTAALASAKIFLKALIVSVTLTPVLLKQVSKILSLGVTVTVSLLRTVQKTLASVVVTVTPVLQRAITKLLWAGTVTLTPALAAMKLILKALAVGVTFTVGLVKQVSKPFALALPVTLAFGRRVNKALALAVTGALILLRAISKNLSVTVTVTAVLAALKAFFKNLTVGVTLTPALLKRAGKAFALGVTLTPTFARQMGHLLVTGITVTPVLTRRIGKLLALGVFHTVALARQQIVLILKSLAVSVPVAVSLVKGITLKPIVEFVVRHLGDNRDPHRLGPARKYWFDRTRRRR